MAKDGEGATKLVEIIVEGAQSETGAKTIAMKVANSPLVKTAIFGNDVNWGRILCAVGYAGVPFNPNKVDLILGGRKENDMNYKNIILVKNGVGTNYSESKAKSILSHPEIQLIINLHQGKAFSIVWTCDLSLDYVKINASYRS